MKKQQIVKRRGLLLVYGSRLPSAGVVFLAPVSRNMLTQVDKAMRICAERWPNTKGRKKYDGIWADGSMSTCDEAKDRAEMLRIKMWDDLRYEWDFETKTFIPFSC